MVTYRKEHTVDLGAVLSRPDLVGSCIGIRLAKARQAARWGLMQQAIAMANQRGLAQARRELEPEDFRRMFGDAETGALQVSAEALEPMTEYAEDVLEKTVTDVLLPLGAPDRETLIEALLALGPAESWMLAQHIEGLHRLGRADPLVARSGGGQLDGPGAEHDPSGALGGAH